MFTIKRLPEFDEWFDGLRDRTTSIRLGVRLDKVQHGAILIVMLGGGDKSSQTSDIAAAKKLATTLIFKE